MEYYRKAKNLFLSRGREAISEFFPYADERLAAGLVGQGSECFGYDDDISRDHAASADRTGSGRTRRRKENTKDA